MTFVQIIDYENTITMEESNPLLVSIVDYDIPPGINTSYLTEAGSMIVALGDGIPDETGAPTADELVWTSDLSLPKKGAWKTKGGGGGDIEIVNKSGTNQTAGTVMIWDADNDEAVKTTSTLRDRRVAGVLSEDVNNNATGKMAVAGKKMTVKVQGNVSRGMWLITSATTGRAQADGYTKPIGAIGMALTEYAGGGAGTVTALIVVDHYLSASNGKAYFAGGYTTTYTNVAQVTSFVTETTALMATANLSVARYQSAGISDSSKGYVSGGYTGSVSAVADKVTYSTDITAAQVSANLSTGRYAIAAVSQRGTKGYYFGGWIASPSAAADKVTYSTDITAAQVSANLSTGRYAIAGSGNESKGYMSGGNTGSSSAVADKVTYSTDLTAAQVSANLSIARFYLGAVTDENLNAYYCGGTTGSIVATADKTQYSTDTNAAQSSANLSVARNGVTGANGSLAGFIAGGNTGSVSAVMDKLTYSTDITAAVGANLPTALERSAGVSSLN